ncbi:MAG TPA: gephyrin-like molybdotransferase Glp [Rhodanobacteraceae bacterium]|nr:gephyrin-like molybdotransferase Glp [Rhodanobacteraceae bacterium]
MSATILASTPQHISLDEARAIVQALTASRPRPTERIATDAAAGRILAQALSAPHALPTFANSAMDGYALRAADLPSTGERRLPLIGRQLAGTAPAPAVAPGTCVRITTGAPLPAGADTVVIQERVRLAGDAVIVSVGTAAGANVRAVGEDFAAGAEVLPAARVLDAGALALLASFGVLKVSVYRRPRVAILTTGDELVPAAAVPGFGQLRDSNGPMLVALARASGAEVVAVRHVGDDAQATELALRELAAIADVLLTSGGASVGDADLLPQLAQRHGRVHFWKVRIKPGMPVLGAEIESALWFALPGNPVSTAATFLTLVRPALRHLGGREPSSMLYAVLAHAVLKPHERVEFLRGSLRCGADARLEFTAHARQGSAQLSGLAASVALGLIPETARELAAGSVIEVLPLPELWP